MMPPPPRLLRSDAVPPTVALSKVMSSWGARHTWAAQREHVAQIVRTVEGCKSVVVTVCISSVQGRGVGSTVPDGRARGQRGWRPNYGTGWKALGMAGFLDGVDVPHVPRCRLYFVPFLTVLYCFMRVF